MKIGIITVPDPAKGLHREAELIAWAIDKSPICSAEIIHLNTIQTDSINQRSIPSHQPTPWSKITDTPIKDWIDDIDVLFLLEVINTNIIDYAIGKTKIVFIPNLEWAIAKRDGVQSTTLWVELVQKYSRKGMIVVAKSPMIKKALSGRGISSELIQWSIPDNVMKARKHREKSEQMTILMNAGMGGWENRRGVDVFVNAIKIMQNNNSFRFILKTIKPWNEYNLGSLPKNVELIEGYISRTKLEKLIQSTDLIMYPSRFEGFGLSMLEAMHKGIPVMCTNGWPMNEIQTVKNNLLMIDSLKEETLRLAVSFEPDPNSIVRNLSELEHKEIRDLFPHDIVTKGLIERQNLFISALHSIAGL